MKRLLRISPALPTTAAGSGPVYDPARGGWYPPAKADTKTGKAAEEKKGGKR